MNSNGFPTALWVVPVPEFGGVARHVVDMARAGLPGFNLVVLAPEGKLTSRLLRNWASPSSRLSSVPTTVLRLLCFFAECY